MTLLVCFSRSRLIQWARTAMLNFERAKKLGTIIRLLLIIVLSMPQGWCCFVRAGQSCCSISKTPPRKSVHRCPCCKDQTPSVCLSDSESVQREALPRSCECRCRSQTGIRPVRPNIVADTLDAGWIDTFSFESFSHVLPKALADRHPDRVSIQILLCRWQC